MTDKIPVSDDTVRQRERTVDNVKRLYAFFLSLSFSNVFRELVERYHQPLKTYADTILQHPVAALQLALPPLLVFAIFFITSSVFYFQADRLFDVRFALAEKDAETHGKVMAEWKPYPFFVAYISLILQMIPFALMSFAFTKRFLMPGVVTEFYFSYALLFIIPGAVTLCKGVGKLFRNEETTPTPITVHWLWINSLSLLAIGLGFAFYLGSWSPIAQSSPLQVSPSSTLWFCLLFVVVASARNFLDYSRVWQFLRLDSATAGKTLWPDGLTMGYLTSAHRGMPFGLTLFVGSFLLTLYNGYNLIAVAAGR